MKATSKNYAALDVGMRRIGVALANGQARLTRPASVIFHDDKVWESIEKLISTEDIGVLVIGLPRNLEGNDTAQTRIVRAFASDIQKKFDVEVVLQDEALTSRMAEAELKVIGKPYDKADIDAMAAKLILDDYLGTLRTGVTS